jgi:3D (Asp-Asp-Asp) domain-containing protein
LVLAVGCTKEQPPLRYPPVVVMSPIRLPGAVVHGATRGWWKGTPRAVRYGDPVPVGVTMYCLRGTTRRDNPVRSGIIAADPRFFPFSGHVELYVGRQYIGRYLVDDTGLRIRGARIDVWTASCPEAERFGMRSGTAVLVHGDRTEVIQAGTAREPK